MPKKSAKIQSEHDQPVNRAQYELQNLTQPASQALTRDADLTQPADRTRCEMQNLTPSDLSASQQEQATENLTANSQQTEKTAQEHDHLNAMNLAERVKQLRSHRNWSLQQMSQICGVSRSMLSQIERNEANPTLAVALRIATAFEMTIGELVGEPGHRRSVIDVVRGDDPTHHFRNDVDCKIRTLSPLHLEKDVEFYEVLLTVGGALRSSPHFKGTREFLTVSHGKISITSGDDQSDLGKGDSAMYPADVPHAIVNTGRVDASLFLVVIYQS